MKCRLVVVGLLLAGFTTPVGMPSAVAASTCLQASPPAHPRAAVLRFGVDPGPAGNLTPSTGGVPAYRLSKDLAAVRGLRAHDRPLVVRLNRLFWSGGDRLLRSFARRAHRYGRAGNDVEVQVRYHPTSAENGDIGAWVRWMRHVVAVLGHNRRLIGLTITNEVNFAVSPNTSDGSYQNADLALVRGIEAGANVLHRHRWWRRVKLGFTYAYRYLPNGDQQFFRDIGSLGGERFRRALGFVGVDDYPGTVYPPSIPPGDTAGHEVQVAVATVRQCLLPLAAIPSSTPIWLTENGFSSSAPAHNDAKQRQQLLSAIRGLHQVAGSEHVTDYRWFTLRDNDSSGSGTFDQDGLLTDHYRRKPSYAAFRRLVRQFSTPLLNRRQRRTVPSVGNDERQ